MNQNKLTNMLFWEKYRPTTLIPLKGEIPIILLPRIRKIFKDETIPFNLILHGTGGLGKTSLLNILTKKSDVLKINSSIDNGVDVVREQIASHCKTFNLFKRGQKVVWLEEFDNSTPEMRKALRGFIEEHSDRIRFIATVNNITKLQRTDEDEALLSRFNIINFNPQNKEEVEFLKNYYIKYCEFVCKKSNIEIDSDVLNNIITRNFPNLRSIIQIIQEISIVGDYDEYINKQHTYNSNVFEFILNGKNNMTENYYYVMENYPREKTEDLLKLLGRPFFKYIIENNADLLLSVGERMLLLNKTYNAEYTITIDPEMHLYCYITELKNLIINK